ncbi:MAG: hypothetical protein ABEI96_05260 [Haloarculaceae archaeon]
MSEFTFFEIHLHDGAFRATANAPFSGRGDESADDEESVIVGDVGSKPGPGLAPAVVVGAVALALLLAWKLLSGGGADVEDA